MVRYLYMYIQCVIRTTLSCICLAGDRLETNYVQYML